MRRRGTMKRRLTHSRTKGGRFRKKRGDTHLSTLEKIYGNISRRRGDTHLETLRKKLCNTESG
jgi:hypothetical protein